MRIISEVKAVKNSVFIQEGNVLSCVHYDTEIFRVEQGILKKLYTETQTSSKMARRCYEYFMGHDISQNEWKQLKTKFNT